MLVGGFEVVLEISTLYCVVFLPKYSVLLSVK